MTPLHIEIALHYYKSRNTRAVVYTGRDTEAIARIHHEFLEAGLLAIAGENNRWKATEKLRLYIETLCSVPLADGQPVNSSHEDSPYAVILQANNIGDTTVNPQRKDCDGSGQIPDSHSAGKDVNARRAGGLQLFTSHINGKIVAAGKARPARTTVYGT